MKLFGSVPRRKPPIVSVDADGNVHVKSAHAGKGGARKSQRVGDNGEKAVAALREVARLRGTARIEIQYVPSKRIPGGRLIPLKRDKSKGQIDGLGWTFDGRLIGEEVKSVEHGDYFGLDEVEPHQRLFLDDLLRVRNALVLVTIVFDPFTRPRVFVVPWAWIRDRSSVKRDELAEFETDARSYPFSKAGAR